MDELDLLNKIKDLENKANHNEFICRVLTENDWETLVSWWDFWPKWQAPPKDFLPDNGTGGLMIEKNNIPIVAGFMYQTNSKGVLLEWIISNPKYKEKDRREAIEKLITEVEKSCIEMGYNYVFTIGRNKSLIEKHRKLGWFVDDKPSHEITKKLK